MAPEALEKQYASVAHYIIMTHLKKNNVNSELISGTPSSTTASLQASPEDAVATPKVTDIATETSSHRNNNNNSNNNNNNNGVDDDNCKEENNSNTQNSNKRQKKNKSHNDNNNNHKKTSKNDKHSMPWTITTTRRGSSG